MPDATDAAAEPQAHEYEARPGGRRPGGRRPGPIALAIMLLAGAGLLWLVITHSYVAYLADRDPEASLGLRVTARAQLNLVERRLVELRARSDAGAAANLSLLDAAGAPRSGEERDRVSVLADLAARRFSNPDPPADAGAIGPRPAEKEQLYQMVRDAVRREPLNARGLRLLAELSEGHAPRAEVARLMQMALRRNLHEPIAVLWLLNDALARRDHAGTFKYADILLRTEGRLQGHAIQALAKACEDGEGLELVLQAVRANPPWRQVFLANLAQYVADARIPLQILAGLKDGPAPPTTQEMAPFFSMLLRNHLHELAYYAWIQFLPPDQLARVLVPFNGDFETQPSGLPFDWVIPKSPNAIAGIVPLAEPGGGKALRIEFGLGRIEFAGVSQLVLLPPGDYSFSAQFTASINGRRGLVWALTCVDGGELARSAMMQGNVAKPTRIAFDFKVPEAGCRAQQLRLFHDSRSASEQFVSGWASQQDVRITRKEERQ